MTVRWPRRAPPDCYHSRRFKSGETPASGRGSTRSSQFIVSVALFALYAVHLVPFAAVYLSVLLKIALMIGAIVTGSLWEHDVFGEWWFAEEFFVEDVMTVNVFLLHVAVVVMFFRMPDQLGAVAGMLAFAYVIYTINVGQYLIQHASGHKPAADGDAAVKSDVAA